MTEAEVEALSYGELQVISSHACEAAIITG